MRSLHRHLVSSVAATSVALAPATGRANPLGGQVTAGTAAIQGQGTSQVVIDQRSTRAVIDWRTFDIAPGESTRFQQPDASSVTLNRVTGGTGASQINGTLSGNGSVYVINPDGMLFGPAATVNVGSFLATTHNISNADFMAGKTGFNLPGTPSASIVNQGTITAAQGGFAALVAPGVRNEGVITANLGTVALAAGNAFTLDLYGDGLIKLQPSDSVSAEIRDVATGRTLKSLVENSGTLRANGGRVSLTSVASRRVIDSVINSTGVVEANTVGTRQGMIVFGAATADAKPAGAPRQVVKASGRIRAAGLDKGTVGGVVQITGEHLELAALDINVSGSSGGGRVLVGGDTGGGRIDHASDHQAAAWETRAIPNATSISAASSVRIDASASRNGDGGKVVIWSNMQTLFDGTIAAKAGETTGNGGFVEISSPRVLSFNGIVDTSAAQGKYGTLLLDPGNLYIVSSSNAEQNFSTTPDSNANGLIRVNYNPINSNSDSFIYAGRIEQQLRTTNVTITSESGDIYINSPIVAPVSEGSARTLIISNASASQSNFQDASARNIYINSPIDGSNLSSLDIEAKNFIIPSSSAYIIAPKAGNKSDGTNNQFTFGYDRNTNQPGGVGSADTPLIIYTPYPISGRQFFGTSQTVTYRPNSDSGFYDYYIAYPTSASTFVTFRTGTPPPVSTPTSPSTPSSPPVISNPGDSPNQNKISQRSNLVAPSDYPFGDAYANKAVLEGRSYIPNPYGLPPVPSPPEKEYFGTNVFGIPIRVFSLGFDYEWRAGSEYNYNQSGARVFENSATIYGLGAKTKVYLFKFEIDGGDSKAALEVLTFNLQAGAALSQANVGVTTGGSAQIFEVSSSQVIQDNDGLKYVVNSTIGAGVAAQYEVGFGKTGLERGGKFGVGLTRGLEIKPAPNRKAEP